MAQDVGALAEQLRGMAAADLRAAAQANSEDPHDRLLWRRLTAEHGDRLRQVMDEFGWPTSELVGEEAASAAWLIAQHADRQHADRQLDVQRDALRLMGQAVEAGVASRRELAFLRDRTLVNDGRQQVYGTLVADVREGAPIPWPCENPDRVEELRAEVGIEPFDEYIAQHSVS